MSIKYIPNYGDLENFRYERLTRTKSRAYQIACWQGYLGTHEFFLGRSIRGWVILLYTMLSAGSFLVDWKLGLLMVVSVVGLNVASVKTIAKSSPDDEIYGDLCGSLFHSFHMLGSRSIVWGTNFWKGKEPTDADTRT